MADNDIEYRVNVSSAQAALRSLEQAAAQVGKTAAKGGKEASDALNQFNEVLKKTQGTFESVNDKAINSNKRFLDSLEKRVTLEGKSGAARINADYDLMAKRIGTNAEQLNRLNKLRERSLELDRLQSASQGQGAGMLALRGARDLFEGRTAYGEVQLGKSLASLSGVGLAAGATAAALGGALIAGHSFAKSLAEIGVQATDVMERTGLSAREFAGFSYAAKAVGQDITVTERIMRGLSVAMEDLSPAGDKARKTASELGVSLKDAGGNSRSTAAVLLDVSQAFSKLTPGTKQAADALELFKRGGIDAIPFLRELAQNYKDFGDHGLPFLSDAELSKFKEWNKQLTDADTRWQYLKTQFKEPIAASFIITYDIVQGKPGAAGAAARALIDRATGDRVGSPEYRDSHLIPGVDFKISSPAVPADFAAGFGGAGGSLSSDFLRSYSQTNREYGQRQLGILKQAQDAAQRAVEGDTPSTLKATQQLHIDTLKQATSEYEKQRDIVKAQELADSRRLGAAEELLKIQRETTALDLKNQFGYGGAADKVIIEKKQANLAFDDLERKYPTIRTQIEAQRAQQNRDFGLRYAFGSIDDQFAERESRARFEKVEVEERYNQRKGLNDIPDLKDIGKQFDVDEYVDKLRLESQKFGINRAASMATRMSELQAGPGGEGVAIQRGYQIRIELAQQLSAIEDQRIAKETDVFLKQKETAQAQKDLAEEMVRAQDELALKQAEMIRKQQDSIAKTAESLYTTLFEHPSKFPKQLATTARTLAIRPLVTGLGEFTGRALHDPIFGVDGTGGIAGASRSIFGGARVEGGALLVKVIELPHTSGNVTSDGGGMATSFLGLPNIGSTESLSGYPMRAVSDALGLRTSFGAAPGAGYFGSLATLAPLLYSAQVLSGGGGGVGGGAVPAGSVSSSISFPGGDQGVDLGTAIYGGGGVSPISSDLGGLGSLSFPGSTTYAGGGGRAGGGFNPLGIFGFGGGGSNASGGNSLARSLSGFGKNFANLGPAFGIGQGTTNTQSVGLYGDTISDNATTFKSVAESPGVGAVAGSIGLPLFMAGIAGNNRGTGAGIGEAAGGGALVGFQYGGPIGAAVGAVAGAGIGLGEMLSGDISDRVKAKRAALSIYHLNISNSAADNIAQIAKSKYADNISVAIRSPEVRQMLGLYAAGTGQAGKFPQSADMPMGGSLVSQGGVLQQSPVYQYGNPYTYSSSLPVAGGNAGGNLPNPGGSTIASASFNISGSSVSSFMNGEVFTPEATAANVQTAYNSSAGRTQASMTIQDPTGIVG